VSLAYYNEFDPHAAEWLRSLIDAGLIMAGDIDERSIVDVKPTDLMGYAQCHFFAGISGWPLALQLAGWPDGRPVWTGSCPCQPFSSAGKRKGRHDSRHLWPVFCRLIAECQPSVVFGEQVASSDIIGKASGKARPSDYPAASTAWIDGVQASLEGAGYACGFHVVGAHSLGAPHVRQRLFWVAESGRTERLGRNCAEARPVQPLHTTNRCGASGMADADSERCDGQRVYLRQREPRQAGSETAGGGEAERLADADHPGSRGGIKGEQGQPGIGRVGLADDGGNGGLADRDGAGLAGRAQQPAREERQATERSGRLGGMERATAGGRGIGGHEAQPGNGGHALGASGAGLGGGEYAVRGRSEGRNPLRPETGQSGYRGPWDDCILIPCRDGKARRTQSGLSPLAHGIPRTLAEIMPRLAELGHDPKAAARMLKEARRHRVVALKGAGNAIVPPLAAEFIRAFMEARK